MQTFGDQIQMLCDRFQATATASANNYLGRQINIAINEAYDEIGRKARWKYYLRRALINTNAAYTTGTVAYVASTNILTITGGTWPSWVLDGEFIINQNIYQPANVLSSTTLSFKSGRSPGADIVAGTGFNLFQSKYVLPTNFFQVLHIEEITKYWQLSYIPLEELHRRQVAFLYPGTPRWYTIVGNSSRHRGTYSAELLPSPADQRTIDMVYRAVPRRRTLPVAANAGSATTAGTQVAITGGVITSAIEGAIVRFGTAQSLPTGPYGANPAAFETTVQQYLTPTTFVLESAPPVDLTSVKFSIEDPVDIDPISMQTLFNAMCATKYARQYQKDDKMISRFEKTEYEEFLKAVSSNEKADIAGMSNQFAPQNIKELTFAQIR